MALVFLETLKKEKKEDNKNYGQCLSSLSKISTYFSNDQIIYFTSSKPNEGSVSIIICPFEDRQEFLLCNSEIFAIFMYCKPDSDNDLFHK